ncbi:MAG: Rossmann-like and DUF2520 domain-containing protein [Terriglobales bacterium]
MPYTAWVSPLVATEAPDKIGRWSPSAILQSVRRPAIAIVGMGCLGTALFGRLTEAGYSVKGISRKGGATSLLNADVVWFCVPDGEIVRAAHSFSQLQWQGKSAFHSSGVLSSDALNCLRTTGGRVASVHPLMTFVKGSLPELTGVPFAIEGDASAVRASKAIVRNLGGQAVAIKKQDKVAYHAFATMICPLLVSLLAASEKTAAHAGMSARESRRRMLPIIRQTLRNYEKLGPAAAFSGPIVRGDVETIRAHLKALSKVPSAKDAYSALARAAMNFLPNRNRRQVVQLFD